MTVFVDNTIKKPSFKDSYTQQQQDEFFKCALDPEYFIENYVKIISKDGAVPFILYDYQREALKNIKENKHNIMLFSRQLGKALALDTPILTTNGWSTMGDIKEGDYVYGDDGKPTEVVVATNVQHNHDCYEVEFDNGEKIVADADHLWVVQSICYNYKYNKVTKTTKELFDSIENVHNKKGSIFIDISDKIDYSDVELPINPYVLGYWLGDGSSSDGRICFSPLDAASILSYLTENGYELGKEYLQRDSCFVQTILKLRPSLRALNLINNKHIPEIYKRSSVNQRIEIISGLIDTDGWADQKHGSYEFYNKNNTLVDDVREILSTLGIKNRIRVKQINDQKYYSVRFKTTRYNFCKLKRKQFENVKHDTEVNYRHYIKSIKKVKSVPVRCIKVDNESEMFLCGKSLIPTHNTSLVQAYLLWYATFHKHKTILVVANNLKAAIEILERIKFSYKELPNHIRDSVVEFNKTSMVFGNGSRIICRATSADSARGLTVDLLYCLDGDTKVKIRNKNTGEIKDVSLEELYGLL